MSAVSPVGKTASIYSCNYDAVRSILVAWWPTALSNIHRPQIATDDVLAVVNPSLRVADRSKRGEIRDHAHPHQDAWFDVGKSSGCWTALDLWDQDHTAWLEILADQSIC